MNAASLRTDREEGLEIYPEKDLAKAIDGAIDRCIEEGVLRSRFFPELMLYTAQVSSSSGSSMGFAYGAATGGTGRDRSTEASCRAGTI